MFFGHFLIPLFVFLSFDIKRVWTCSFFWMLTFVQTCLFTIDITISHASWTHKLLLHLSSFLSFSLSFFLAQLQFSFSFTFLHFMFLFCSSKTTFLVVFFTSTSFWDCICYFSNSSAFSFFFYVCLSLSSSMSAFSFFFYVCHSLNISVSFHEKHTCSYEAYK